MAKYQYTALKNNKEIVKGEVEASTPREAREKIRTLGFVPTKVYTEYADTVGQTVEKNKLKYLSLDDKIMFTSELEVMLSSGISVLEALASIEKNTYKEKIKEICMQLSSDIQSGMTFAQSLSNNYGNVFGSVYIGLVKSGEDAGELDVTLGRMLVLLRKQQNIKSKIVNASIYPAILTLIMTGVLILFSKFVFPTFFGIIAGNGGCLPCMANLLMNICNFVNSFWWAILGAMAGCVFGFKTLMKNVCFKRALDDIVLSIPVVSEFFRYINLSNFMTVLHISYDAGLPIMSCLELSNKTIGNLVIKDQAKQAEELVKKGVPLTEAFNRSGVMPSALMSMISAGEMSGTLGKMLHNAAEVIDKKVDMALEAMTRLFEPTVIVIMGVAVLFIAIAFVQAYYGMLGSLF